MPERAANTFVELRDPANGQVLARYDPERRLLSIPNRRGRIILFDLAQYEERVKLNAER